MAKIQKDHLCEICNEITGGTNNSFRILFDSSEFPDRFAVQTKKFVVTPGIGALLPGYSLIWTKQHLESLSLLKRSDLEQLYLLANEIQKKVSEKQGMATIVFEHGTGAKHGESVGCGACIDHAHLHICPTPIDLEPAIHLGKHRKHLVSSYGDLNQFRGQSYLFMTSLDGSMYVYTDTHFPSQFMRRLWADALSTPDLWDWGVFPYKKNMFDTYVMLSSPK